MKLNIKEIKLNEHNPRDITPEMFEKLKKSIQEFPQMLETRPLVIDENNVVLGGNMRLRALIDLGYEEIPVQKVEGWSEEQKKEFVVKDNLSYGVWDWELLANSWDAEQLEEWGLEVPDWETKELEAEEDNYQVPDEIETDIQLGDLFQIGKHRLMCGDSTQTDSWSKIFQSELADMVVTDPPYNVAYVGKTKDALTIKNDSMSNSDFYKFLYDFYTALGSFTKAGGAWYVWHADSEGANFRKAMSDSGIMVKQCLIWVKQSMVMGRQDYQWKHEPCLYGWKEGASHNWYSDRKQTTVLQFDRPSRNAEHPTMKPVELISYQISNSSKIGDLIADGFLGSGTTMVAAHQLNRKCYGMELDPKYCQVIIDRMKKLDPNITITKL